MKHSELQQLIREEIQNMFGGPNPRYSYPYYKLRIENHSHISLVSSIYDQMEDYGSFKDISDKSDTGGTYIFQNHEDFNKFYRNLESNGIPEEAMVGLQLKRST